MLKKVSAIFAKFFQNKVFGHATHASKRINAKFFQMSLRAFANTPNIRKRCIKPDIFLKQLTIQHADAVFAMLCANIKRYFSKEQIRAYTNRCCNMGFHKYRLLQTLRKLYSGYLIELQIRRYINKTFINAVGI